ncbi:MAG: protein translocase subunit SecD [Micavibrio sp.]|nr:MAG: protein translocase subunit SecD [Micavibrio sp.]
MVNIAPWKIVLVLIVCVLGFAYSAPNVAGDGARGWLQENLPSWMPTKTVNLGLDLRGGAHLLYEVEVGVVFKERADMMVQDLRKSLREEKIGYTRIGAIPKGVRVTLRDKEDGEKARKILRTSNNNNLEILTGQDGKTIEGKMNEIAEKDVLDQTISQSIEIVRRRVDELGTTEPSIQRQGENRILLQVPGANAEDLKAIIGKTAKLGFHLVSNTQGGVSGLTLPMLDEPGRVITIERRAIITGDMLETASPSFQQGEAVVSFRLNGVGGRRFCDVTRNNVGKPFAIVLDNEIISAPNIREQICGGQGVISGSFTVQSANELALLLRAGALPAPMEVVEERSVGPSLGADSVEAGKKASLIGLAFILVFMLLAYGLFGFMADVALVVNVALIFAILSGLQATLTLPGIAGIVLTVGMAVDANVLIFERIREELRAGRSPISAIDAGYSRAMATIIDSNLTTLIAAIILFSFGTGPVKGFAVTLGIGIMTSFFTAIMVTRLLVVAWLRKTKPSVVPI